MNETATATDRWTATQCRVSRRLFGIVGDAGASSADPALAIALTELAGMLAWHAQLYFELLPARVDVDREALVDDPVGGADTLCAQVAAAREGGASTTLSLLLARVVLPRLAAGVHDAAGRTDRALDGARSRVLTLVARDLVDARGALERHAERLLAQDARPSDALQVALDADVALVSAGVAVGVCAPAERLRG